MTNTTDLSKRAALRVLSLSFLSLGPPFFQPAAAGSLKAPRVRAWRGLTLVTCKKKPQPGRADPLHAPTRGNFILIDRTRGKVMV